MIISLIPKCKLSLFTAENSLQATTQKLLYFSYALVFKLAMKQNFMITISNPISQNEIISSKNVISCSKGLNLNKNHRNRK